MHMTKLLAVSLAPTSLTAFDAMAFAVTYATSLDAELTSDRVIELGLSTGATVDAVFRLGVLFGADGIPKGQFGRPGRSPAAGSGSSIAAEA